MKKVLEQQYDDRCTVYERQAKTDPQSGLTSFEEVELLREQPCKLSVESIAAAGGLGAAARGTGVAAAGGTAGAGKIAAAAAPVAQKIKLFLPPDVPVRPGSRIRVRGRDYAGSGIPALYDSHQEIMLTAFQGWA